MKVLTILARFGTDQYADAEHEIAAIFERQMPGVDRTVIVVDNALPEATIEHRPGRTLLGGDNRSFEFSAFDRAVSHLGRDLDGYDLVHFATSAFNTLYVAYLDRFSEALLTAAARRPVCVGHIDCYNEPVDIRRFRSQHWIRSGFFFLPPAEVRLLGRFAAIANRSEFFTGRPESPFRADAPLSARYQTYITDWLTGRDIGQGVEWHSSFALSAATLPSFERKALCIMTEQLLGLRLRASGCRLVDVTWLSTQLARRRADQVRWQAPWREQLAGRDRDAIVVPASVAAG